MIDFVNYIFESGISLGLFTILYLILLQKETFFKTNRYFLLSGLLFSLILPLIHLKILTSEPVMLDEITVLPYRNMLAAVSVYGTSLSESIVHTISTSTYLIVVYVVGILFFASRLLFRIAQIVSMIRQNQVISEGAMNLVFLEKEISPFSFLSYVFVGKNLKEQTGWEKILTHEFEHVRQRHSFDIVILEIISVFQWFNPFFWLLKRVLRENHEYLADQAVLKIDANKTAYKQILLKQFIGPQLLMANNFNYSMIKKRIKMMSQIKSSKLSNIKLSGGLFIAIALIVVFACEKKDTLQTELDHSEKVVLIEGENGTVTLSGNAEQINKLTEIIGSSSNFDLVANETGNLKMIKKSEDVGEVAVVGYKVAKALKDNKDIVDEEVFHIVEEMPEYPEGELALRKYIANKIKYPRDAQDAGAQGKVYVTFVVEKDGTVGRAKVVRGVHSSLDQEALRVVSSMPRWTPGKQKGEAVAVSYTVPINFVLQ